MIWSAPSPTQATKRIPGGLFSRRSRGSSLSGFVFRWVVPPRCATSPPLLLPLSIPARSFSGTWADSRRCSADTRTPLSGTRSLSFLLKKGSRSFRLGLDPLSSSGAGSFFSGHAFPFFPFPYEMTFRRVIRAFFFSFRKAISDGRLPWTPPPSLPYREDAFFPTRNPQFARQAILLYKFFFPGFFPSHLMRTSLLFPRVSFLEAVFSSPSLFFFIMRNSTLSSTSTRFL